MSIASRITSIEGHIGDIYDSVELTGVDTTDIDKNLVNVPNTLKEGYIDIINNGTDTLYNNFPKVSGEGTSLTLNNTYQAPMRNNLKGNTSQTGTPTPTSPIPVNVVSGDNTITISNQGGTDSNTYNIDLPSGMELCKIGNYQDYFYKDSDKWYLHKEIGKVVLNGSEPTWGRADGNDNYRDFRIPISDIALANTDPIGYIDNRFVAKTSSYWNENGEHLVQMNDKRLSFRIAVSRLTDSTRESWISWLTNNHITTYYALATPTNTEITDTTLINQLEELYIAKSKENQTNISQINNDLGFIISASALKKG